MINNDGNTADGVLRSFNTAKILHLIDVMDGLGARVGSPAGLRGDVLDFHIIANRIVNQAPYPPSREMLNELAANAADLAMELDEWAVHLYDASRLLESIVLAVAPRGSCDNRGGSKRDDHRNPHA